MPKYIDLTHPLHEGMQTPPSPQPIVEFTQISRIFLDCIKTTRVTFATHCGTHIDSPSHMFEDKHPFVDEMPLATLVGPAKIAKFRRERHGVVTKADLLSAGVELEKGDRLVVSFGWYPNWMSKKYFDNYPTFSADAIAYMVESEIALVGMDIPSPDRMDYSWDQPERTVNHKTLMQGDVLIVEGLTNLEDIPDGGPFQFIALPLKAVGLDGFPVRAIAVCE